MQCWRVIKTVFFLSRHTGKYNIKTFWLSMECAWMFKMAGWFPWISSLSCAPQVWRIKSSTKKETLLGWRRMLQLKYFDVPCISYWGWNFFTILALFIGILSCPTCWFVNALAIIYLFSRLWKSCRCFTLLKMMITFIWADLNNNYTCLKARADVFPVC